MKKLEFLSILNRAFGMISTLLLVLMNLHFVHVEGQGTIALINFGILIVATLSQFIGGGALIYLIPRMGENKIALPSIVWIVISASITFVLLLALGAPFIGFTLTPRNLTITLRIATNDLTWKRKNRILSNSTFHTICFFIVLRGVFLFHHRLGNNGLHFRTTSFIYCYGLCGILSHSTCLEKDAFRFIENRFTANCKAWWLCAIGEYFPFRKSTILLVFPRKSWRRRENFYGRFFHSSNACS